GPARGPRRAAALAHPRALVRRFVLVLPGRNAARRAVHPHCPAGHSPRPCARNPSPARRRLPARPALRRPDFPPRAAVKSGGYAWLGAPLPSVIQIHKQKTSGRCEIRPEIFVGNKIVAV